MAQYVPIPPRLWQRLAALDRVCDVRLVRRDTASPGIQTSGRNFSRMWCVEIWRRDSGEGSKIIAEGADLAGTLEVAVGSAERKFGSM